MSEQLRVCPECAQASSTYYRSCKCGHQFTGGEQVIQATIAPPRVGNGPIPAPGAPPESALDAAAQNRDPDGPSRGQLNTKWVVGALVLAIVGSGLVMLNTVSNPPYNAAAQDAGAGRQSTPAQLDASDRDIEVHVMWLQMGPNHQPYVPLGGRPDFDGTILCTGTITNIGSGTAPSVSVWCHEQGFTIGLDGTRYRCEVMPKAYKQVLLGTFRNLRPGETRQVQSVVSMDQGAVYGARSGTGIDAGPFTISFEAHVDATIDATHAALVGTPEPTRLPSPDFSHVTALAVGATNADGVQIVRRVGGDTVKVLYTCPAGQELGVAGQIGAWYCVVMADHSLGCVLVDRVTLTRYMSKEAAQKAALRAGGGE